MFEQALAETKVSSKRKASFISTALVLHGGVLLAVLFGQYWAVAAVEEPPIMVSFFEAAPPPPPPPPPAPPPPPKAAAPTPVTPQPVTTEVVQPEIVPEELPPETPAVATSDVGVEGGVEGGIPGGVAGGIPGGVEGGIPQEPAEDQIFQVGGNVVEPVVISRTPPTYTETARRARTQGTVVLEAVINKQGEVTNVKVLKSLPFGLDRQAVESIQRWKFKPATMDGRPVSVYYVLTVQFKIQ
jgi:protein TonB